ncbi:MAG: hypothetical protein M1165_00785 [Candidatus Pacearchaeota archaeon]|nr:hypothetical protein [Candidatus Pacearchaeota archaeon]
MEKGENFIHVRFEFAEAVQSKKDLLSSEMDLLNLIKSMQRYIFLREMETKLKSRFYRELKKTTMYIKLLEANMPQIKIPRILKHHEEKSVSSLPGLKTKNESDLESQLMEIQKRLKALSY